MKKSFKTALTTAICLFFITASAQSYRLERVWETDSILKVPESVLFYPEEKMLFVSNIDGKSDEKDLKGSIAKISLEGKVVSPDWAINLSAPKGMGIYKNTLYVSDLAEVVAIDIKSGKTTGRASIEGAVFLNDITISKSGAIYVSDSRTGRVHLIENGKPSIFLTDQMGVNGLLSVGTDLYLAVKGTLLKADKNKNLTKIAEGMDESTDGIEQTSNKNFIVSCWNGIIYHVKADGTKQELLDTRAQKLNTADIGFDAKNNIIYVPTFFGDKVVSYQLK
jgi:hypothetical protein